MCPTLAARHGGATLIGHTVEKRRVEKCGREKNAILRRQQRVTRQGQDWGAFQSSAAFGKNWEKVEQCGRWPQQTCTPMFFLIPKKRHERASHCAYAYDDSLVGRPASGIEWDVTDFA